MQIWCNNNVIITQCAHRGEILKPRCMDQKFPDRSEAWQQSSLVSGVIKVCVKFQSGIIILT